jgi:hypothetical protein
MDAAAPIIPQNEYRRGAIVPIETIVYACNHCGRRYDDVRQAADCEQRHLTAQGNTTTGCCRVFPSSHGKGGERV